MSIMLLALSAAVIILIAVGLIGWMTFYIIGFRPAPSSLKKPPPEAEPEEK